MKHLLVLFCLWAGVSAFLQAQQPALIDRETFFDNPEMAGAQLSPNAQWMTFVKPHKGVMNIWIKRTKDDFAKARPISADTVRPIRGYFWTDDSKYVLYVQDKGGNEDFHVFAINPFAPNEKATGVPPVRNLTPLEKTRAFLYQVSQKDPNKMWVGLNNRDQAWHDLYEINIATGERKLIRQNTDRLTGWTFDWDENLRFASRNTDDGSTEILRADSDKFVKVYEVGPLESAYIVGFSADNKTPYLITNKDRNFQELVLMDAQTGKETFVERDPDNRVDLSVAAFNDKTHTLQYTLYTDAKPRIYWKDKALQADYELLKKRFEGKEIGFNSMDKSQRLALISVNSDTDPGAVYLFDRKSKKTVFQYRPRPKLKPEMLSPMQPITYKSSDGLEIPAYLTTPKGLAAKNLPLIVIPHGGPWSRDFWGYNSYAQYWSNRGYAVLQMNFRGSTGYGKAFLDAGNGQWGEKMQDDITWGVKHLTAQGIADPNRVGILGGSYGGYATLAGVTFTPDLYKSAVAVVAPSNLNTLLASIPPYWESIRKMFYLRMADPTTPEGKAQLERQSPLNHVDKIKTPLLIVQGANDPRVKKPEADQIVVAMREKGIPVAYICADDEGHGFARPVNNMAYLAAAEKFMAQHLGGRYQESMKPEVAKRLQQITIDPKTVTKPKRADEIAAEAAGRSGHPIRDFVPAEYQYDVKVEAGGQKIGMQAKREVKSDGNNWIVSDEAKSMMGTVKDQNVVEKNTMKGLSRQVEQGPMKVEVKYGADEVTGNTEMAGKKQAFSTKTTDFLVPNGAGEDLYLALMPMEVGKNFFYKTYNVQKQAVTTYEVKVLRKESVTVPAGTFEALVLDIKDATGEPGDRTLWVANGVPVKSVATMPQMGGAKVTSELTVLKEERP